MVFTMRDERGAQPALPSQGPETPSLLRSKALLPTHPGFSARRLRRCPSDLEQVAAHFIPPKEGGEAG